MAATGAGNTIFACVGDQFLLGLFQFGDRGFRCGGHLFQFGGQHLLNDRPIAKGAETAAGGGIVQGQYAAYFK